MFENSKAKITTLDEFFAAMRASRAQRVILVEQILQGQILGPDSWQTLSELLTTLEHIPLKDGQKVLRLTGQREIQVDMSYEVGELIKDILYLQDGYPALRGRQEELYPAFAAEVASGRAFVEQAPLNNIISDRDGTLNNYGARYLTSVQSIYNAVALTTASAALPATFVILTSAPLDQGGLVDLLCAPPHAFVLAGSKGREFFNTAGQRLTFPVAAEQQAILNQLNATLRQLVADKKYDIFTLIGSGLQFKFGQTTIAHQDINSSIPTDLEQEFLNKVKQITRDLDPQGEHLLWEDTGYDLEIILTVGDGQSARDFDKGDGVAFLIAKAPLKITAGTTLVCGDTFSDLPIIAASLQHDPQARAIMVTQDEQLKEKTRALTANCFFVSVPDVLVAILAATAPRKDQR